MTEETFERRWEEYVQRRKETVLRRQPFWDIWTVSRDGNGNIIAALIHDGIVVVGGMAVLGRNDPASHNWNPEMDEFIGKPTIVRSIRESTDYVNGRAKRLLAHVSIDGGVFVWEVDAMSVPEPYQRVPA